MAITVAMRTQVAQLYTALFGRAPEADGLGYWVNEMGNGKSFAQVADAMYATSPARVYYPSFLTNDEIVGRFYTNVLGRTATADDITYWSGKLGTKGATPGSVISDMIYAVTAYAGTDAAALASQSLFNNKVTVGLYYAVDLGGNDVAKAGTILQGVTSAAASVDAAKAVATTAAGQTFTLTTATDNFIGSSGNDLFIGDFGTTTVNSSDQLNGGSGTDTLKLFGAIGATTALPVASSSIEVLEFVNPGDLNATALNLTTVGAPSSVTKLQIDQANTAAGGATITTTGHSGLTLDLATLNGVDVGGAVTWAANVTDTTQNLELSGYNGATGATAQALTITGAATTTTNIVTDTAANTITTLTVPGTTVNINAATNLSISTSLAATAASKLNVSGAGKVTISGSDLAATVTVDGTANTGGVLYTAEAAGSTLTFKGGSGNDRVTFAAGTLTTADTLTGGTGTDTLVINDTALTTAGNLTAVNAATGFEVLGLATTGASLDLALLTNGINGVRISGTGNSATTTNSLATTTYTIDNSGGNTGTVSIGNKVGELATSVTVDYGTATGAQTVAQVTLNGATTVALNSTGTGTGGSNVISTLANMDNSVITITGNKGLTITNAIAGVGTGSKIDATAFTGALNVTGSGQADIIIGGTKADTINGGAGKDIITGGAGNDVVTVNAASQADVITGGDGADTIKFSGDATTMMKTSTGTSDIVTITDFVAATDKIGLVNSTGAFTSVTLATQTVATAADLTAVWAGITGVAASANGGAASAVLVTVSAGAAAGTYLYVNDTAGAGVSNTDDMLVKLTGLSGTLAVTDFVFA